MVKNKKMNIFIKEKNLWTIYAVHAIDALAFSISSIFVPIFLLTKGETIRTVVVYFIIHNIILLLAALVSGLVSQKFGLKKAIILRYPFLFAFLFMLFYWDSSASIVYLAIFSGAQAGFFWIPLNIFFGRHANIKRLGASIAKLSVIPQIASLFGPVLGAVVATMFGFESLFFITFIISIFSFLPLLFSPGLQENFKFSPLKGILFFIHRPKILIADIVDNIGGETEGIVWPIFVFLTIQSTISVGIVGAFIALGSLLFTVIVGKTTDKYSEIILIRLAVPLLVLIWGIRIFIQTDLAIYLTTIVAGFALALFTVPYTRLLFAKAKRDRNESFYIMKEFPTVIGRLIILSLFFVFANNITLLFPIAGLSYLYFLFIK